MNCREHIEEPKITYVELSTDSDPTFEIASCIFLENKKSAIQIENDADFLDLFCMSLEITLNGIDLLGIDKNLLFSDVFNADELAELLNNHLKNAGITIYITEWFCDTNEFIENNDCYCMISNKKHKKYGAINNFGFCMNINNIKNPQPRAFFVNNNKIYIVKYSYVNHV